MTREDFIAGVEFKIGSSNFRLDKNDNHIIRVFRSTDQTRIVLEDYHVNIEVIGKSQFESYTYIMNKKVVRKIKFSELEAV
jgi:hypothetical protein